MPFFPPLPVKPHFCISPRNPSVAVPVNATYQPPGECALYHCDKRINESTAEEQIMFVITG